MGERLESNQQPVAYEATALPLSYAPVYFAFALPMSRGCEVRDSVFKKP